MRIRTGRRLSIFEWLWIAVLLIALVGSPGHGQSGSESNINLLSFLLKGVELTEAQMAELQTIRDRHQPRLRELMTQIQTVRAEMATRIFGPGEISGAGVTPQLKRLVALRGQFAQAGLDVTLAVRAMLTETQRAQVAKRLKRWQAVRTELRRLHEGQP